MAKQIITQVWCDNEQAHGEERASANSHRVAVDGPPVELDLCDPCAETLIGPLRRLAEEHGQPLPVGPAKSSKRKGRPKNVACPECGSNHPTMNALRVHMVSAHGSSKGLVSRVSESQGGGLTCPECGKDHTKPAHLRNHLKKVHGAEVDATPNAEGMYPCPMCEKEFTTTQGLGRHRSVTHPDALPLFGASA